MNAAGTNHSMRSVGLFCVSVKCGINFDSPMFDWLIDFVVDDLRGLLQIHARLRAPARESYECLTRMRCEP